MVIEEPIKYELKAVIAEDQKDYICRVREWLHDGLKGKGKMVGGPSDNSSEVREN